MSPARPPLRLTLIAALDRATHYRKRCLSQKLCVWCDHQYMQHFLAVRRGDIPNQHSCGFCRVVA